MTIAQCNPSINEQVSGNKSPLTKSVYWIEGLFCGNCAKSLEKKITALNIIKSVSINFTYSYMIVDHYDDTDMITSLEQSVKKLGYKLTHANLASRKQQLEQQQKKAYSILFFAFLFSMWSMLCAVVTYMHAPEELAEQTLYFLNVASGLFSIPVVFIAGFHFHKMAWLALKNHLFNIDLLISTSALSAFGISAYFLCYQIDIVYFDTACMLILLHLFGRTLDLNSKAKALQCLEEEMALSQSKTILIEGVNQQLQTIDINEIKAGDRLILRSGDRLPVDGELISAHAVINTSVLTGESSPVDYQCNQDLAAGYINIGQSILVKAKCALGSSATDYQLIDILINKAKQSNHSDKLNQLSSFLSKLIFTTSLFAGLYIYFTQADLQMAFERILCVLVIACPCSLTIAMPMASLILNRQSVKKKIVINNYHNFIEARKLSEWYFDKTGTLTVGMPRLRNITLLSPSLTSEVLLQHAYQCVYHSGHIYSDLVRRHITDNITPNLMAGEHHEVVGCGIEWTSLDNSKTISFTSKKWLVEHDIFLAGEEKHTASYLCINKEPVAIFEFEDTVKPQVKMILTSISEHVDTIGMLSGDNDAACQKIAEQLNIEQKNCYSGLNPQQKQTIISERLAANKKIAYVGDGLNDNLALMQADIGVATQNASALTKMSATVCLLSEDLTTLIELKPLAALYHQLIQRNIIYAIAYNLIAIPIAVLGNISPLVAISAMAASSLSISINSYLYNQKMDAL